MSGVAASYRNWIASSRGEFVFILDSDIELDPDFLAIAVAEKRASDKLGGVAGIDEDMSAASYQTRGYKWHENEIQTGAVRWLNMGGL